MSIKKIVFAALYLFVIISNAQTTSTNTEWSVVSSSVKFKIKNAGFNVDGTFTGLVAIVRFDASKSYGNSIEASIDAKSVNTKNESRDHHLKKADYFDVEKYPKITMKATIFSKEKDGSYKGYFKLTIKNKSSDFFVPFTIIEKDGKMTMNATFTINRLDYGVGESSMILSNNATITINVILAKK